MKQQKKITIKDIADAAGFSKTAVSFAFNNPSRLHSATAEKILATARELGYSPDPLARSLSTKRTGIIGLLLPQELPIVSQNHLFSDLLYGIGETMQQNNFSILLLPPVKGSMADAISNAAVDGFLTWGLERDHQAIETLERRNIPYVMLDADFSADIPCVNIDDHHGAYGVMKYVLQHGHRSIHIVVFSNPNGVDVDQYRGTLRERILGYEKALKEYDLSLQSPGIHISPQLVTKQAGYEYMHAVWDESSAKPTAIVSMSDTCAIGMIEYCNTHAISVPGDVSVTGFDDIPEAGLIRPRLTTVSQPGVEKGRIAARLLHEVLNNTLSTPHLQLPTALIVRESVGRPDRQHML